MFKKAYHHWSYRITPQVWFQIIFLFPWFNISAENPYVAAQRFLDANDLPHTYLDEVVKFIEKNTTPVNLGGSDEYVDPFTGISF